LSASSPSGSFSVSVSYPDTVVAGTTVNATESAQLQRAGIVERVGRTYLLKVPARELA
jgi:hypothetical protein